jgi:hypothetical protein
MMGLLRFPVLACAMALLLAGMMAGLARLDWPVPLMAAPERASLHGGLMISGFLGTLISLERAVGLGRLWAYAGPIVTAAGGIALLFGLPPEQALGLIFLGSLPLALVFIPYLVRQPNVHQALMTAGACLWVAGNALWWHGWPIYAVTPWWMGFLLLTIAGERLELSRLLRLSMGAYAWLLGSLAMFVLGILVKTYGQYGLAVLPSFGTQILAWGEGLLGLGMFAVAAWLLHHDMARRTLRQGGLHGYVATALLSGYIWLAVAGVIGMTAVALPGGPGFLVAGPIYDAAIHAFTVGFVLGMILGHGPLIFPAVLGIPITFRRLFYLPLFVLNAGLLLRLTGDLSGWRTAQIWGGTANVVALLLFLLTMIGTVVGGVTQSIIRPRMSHIRRCENR